MWKDERWKFSGKLVQLTIKKSRSQLSEEETHILNTMNRILDEKNGDWFEGTEAYKKLSLPPSIKAHR
ncbi:hypothetical protein D3C71_1867970 [compost metagenome]